METTRQNRISRLLQKELGEIFLREGKHLAGDCMVTVTHVKITPDLSIARAHLSIYKSKNAKQTLEEIKTHSREIRGKLGSRIKNQLRSIPEIEFFLDESLDYAENINRIFKEIAIPKETKVDNKDYRKEG